MDSCWQEEVTAQGQCHSCNDLEKVRRQRVWLPDDSSWWLNIMLSSSTWYQYQVPVPGLKVCRTILVGKLHIQTRADVNSSPGSQFVFCFSDYTKFMSPDFLNLKTSSRDWVFFLASLMEQKIQNPNKNQVVFHFLNFLTLWTLLINYQSQCYSIIINNTIQTWRHTLVSPFLQL